MLFCAQSPLEDVMAVTSTKRAVTFRTLCGSRPGAAKAKEPATVPAWLSEMNERHAMIGNYGGKCVIVEWVPSIAFLGTMEMQHQNLTAFRERHLGR